ncbi:MAG: bifunctional phosphoribosyl-AMP cyclohydrolase/phosphoribosyl-ATP diphosphatase HisIE [bacterium]
MIDVSKLDFEKANGLIPAIIIDKFTSQVLMLGFMNKEALTKTIESGKVTFFSRTRNELWIKGETSGNFLLVSEIVADCDNDSLIVYAAPTGPTCHTGDYSCFRAEKNNSGFLTYLGKLIKERKEKLPEGSYTTKLFKEGRDRIIQKFGEESIECLIAAKNGNKQQIKYEVADLLFHLLVMLEEQDIQFDEVVEELISRHFKK